GMGQTRATTDTQISAKKMAPKQHQPIVAHNTRGTYLKQPDWLGLGLPSASGDSALTGSCAGLVVTGVSIALGTELRNFCRSASSVLRCCSSRSVNSKGCKHPLVAHMGNSMTALQRTVQSPT